MIEEIADFYLSHKPRTNRNDLLNALNKHVEYGTITVFHDKLGISGLLLIDVHGECAQVKDLMIREDMRNAGMIKQMTIAMWSKFPFLRFYRYSRKSKYPDRPIRAHRLVQLVKEK